MKSTLAILFNSIIRRSSEPNFYTQNLALKEFSLTQCLPFLLKNLFDNFDTFHINFTRSVNKVFLDPIDMKTLWHSEILTGFCFTPVMQFELESSK